MKLISYSDIFESDDLGLYWKGSEYYPAENVEQGRSQLQGRIDASRIWIDGANEHSDQYDQVFETAYGLLYDVLYGRDVPGYLFKVEDDPKTPNRIRSFKGILPKKDLDPESYQEKEFNISDSNNTIIISVVELSKNNFKKVIENIGNTRKCFVVQGLSRDIFGEKLLHEIFCDGLRADFTVNYLNLLRLIYDRFDCLYRFSGDGGDTFLGIDFFYKSGDIRISNLVQEVALKASSQSR